MDWPCIFTEKWTYFQTLLTPISGGPKTRYRKTCQKSDFDSLELIRDPGVKRYPLAVAIVARQRGGHAHFAGDGKALPIGRREKAATPGLAQRQAVVIIHHRAKRGTQCVLANIPGIAPDQLVVRNNGILGHLGQPEIEGLGQQAGVEIQQKMGAARLTAR